MIATVETPKRRLWLKDITGIIIFLVLVFLGYLFINAFVFRSFNVEGPSMEKTLYTGDKLIVNKIPLTLAKLQGKDYVPERGHVIVFKNPDYSLMGRDEYIVKRVIAFGGEKVIVLHGKVTVINKAHPKGFNPDELTTDQEGSPTTGDVERTVQNGEIFVMGDHRTGNFSFDSRNGLGTIPLDDVVGPVGLRIFPFQNIRTF
jgi:signal peptidase I